MLTYVDRTSASLVVLKVFRRGLCDSWLTTTVDCCGVEAKSLPDEACECGSLVAK